jgi:uncharacterized protein YndB with AHSA1/START domain
MLKLVRVLTFVTALLVAMFGVVGIIGFTLPRHHHAASRAFYRTSRDSVWAVIADMQHSPAWRTDVTGVEKLADHDGHAVWKQLANQGPWALELTEVTPPSRLVATVADSSQGYGGAWTYTLADSAGGTVVTLAEDGFVDNPMFRFLARFVFGMNTGQQVYLRDLARRLGQTATPRAL